MAHRMAPFPGLLLLLLLVYTASRNSVVYRCLDFYLHSGLVGWLAGWSLTSIFSTNTCILETNSGLILRRSVTKLWFHGQTFGVSPSFRTDMLALECILSTNQIEDQLTILAARVMQKADSCECSLLLRVKRRLPHSNLQKFGWQSGLGIVTLIANVLVFKITAN